MGKTKTLVLSLSVALLGGALAIAQDGPAPARAAASRSAGNTITVPGALVWLEKSDISALREGVLRGIEYQVGARVKEGAEIGTLHDELAKLSVEKAQVQANSQGQIAEASAQVKLAKALLVKQYRLRDKNPAFVSREEIEKAEAEVAVAEAKEITAKDTKEIAARELLLQNRILEEHRVIAPFGGVITERYKNPEESVRANEPIVQLVRTDKLKFTGWVPLEESARIKVGDPVEVIPTIEGADLAIERMRFRGRVMSLPPELNSTGRTEVQLLAEIDNPAGPENSRMELAAGMKVDLIVYVDGAQPAQGAAAENSRAAAARR